MSPVRLSAVPKNSVGEGDLIPTLTGPDGETVELTPDTTSVAGAKVSVTENNKLPGMVDIAMEKDGDSWAGAWTFGYKAAEGTDGEYLASVVMVPGLNLDLKTEDGAKVEGGINSDQILKGQLVDGRASHVRWRVRNPLRGVRTRGRRPGRPCRECADHRWTAGRYSAGQGGKRGIRSVANPRGDHYQRNG